MDITLINVPFKHGCGKDGVEQAFSSLGESRLNQMIVSSGHNLSQVETIKVTDIDINNVEQENLKLKNLKSVIDVNKQLKEIVYNNLKEDNFVLSIGGDHSIAIGSIAGVSKYYKDVVIVYIDAHADMNTDHTSKSHNIHGMSLAVCMDHGHKDLVNILSDKEIISPSNVYHLGGRDIEAEEYKLISKLNMDIYSMDKVKEIGLTTAVNEIVNNIKEKKVKQIHISFDIDVMDASLIAGTGYPVVNGFDLNEVKFIFTKLLETKLVKSLDFVEYNPLLDDKDQNTKKISLQIIEHIFKQL